MKKTRDFYEFSIRIPVSRDDAQIGIAVHCDNPGGVLEQAIMAELLCTATEICRGMRRGQLNDYERTHDGIWFKIKNEAA